jgi:hypothetical protein
MEKNVHNDEISLKELLRKIQVWLAYLLSKWKVIVMTVIIGSAVGVTYSLIIKPIYTATLSFALEDDKGSGGGLGSALGLANTLGLDIGASGGSIFAGSNLTELFKSRSMVEKTLLSPVISNGKKISLAELYIQNENWRQKWNGNSKFERIEFLPIASRKLFSRVQDSILGKIYEELSLKGLSVAQRDKKIAIINISVSSTNEFFAKNFCEALAKQVSDFYIETKSKKARMNMAILQRQTDSIRAELNSAITGVAIANDETFNLNPALNIRRAPSARRQVDVQANTAILTELVKQSELAKVTLRKETPLIQVIDRPILPLKKDKFGTIKGFLIGGAIAGFLTILFLILKRLIKLLK